MKVTNNRQTKKQQQQQPKRKGQNGPRSNQQAVIRELEKIVRARVVPRKKKNSASGKPNALSTHPLFKSVTGILSPFSVAKGSFGGLLDPRPSQKFSGRGLISYQIPAGEEFMAFVYPNIANDNTLPSMTLNYGSTANMALATSTFTSSTVGATPANITQIHAITATPYNVATLNTGQNNWRLLSAAVRIRWTGANLYRGGLFKYYHDTRGDILNDRLNDLNNTTFADLAARLDSHAGVIRHNLADIPELLMNFPSVTDESQIWASAPQYAPGNQEFNNTRIGGTTSTRLAGQPIAYIYGVNTTGQSMYFDGEIVEHWEICGRNVDALNTPSCGNVELANSLSTLVVSAHQHLSHNPSVPYHAALKRLMKDPHVKGAFSGVASQLVGAAVAAL